ncbi:MAG: hypothetical protein ABIH76_04370 [Candidatus Bathyarchaeota archaeon]
MALPQGVRFQEWFEKKLKEKLKAKSHADLKKKLDEAYQEDPSELKLLLQALLAEYNRLHELESPLKYRKKREIEISGVV